MSLVKFNKVNQDKTYSLEFPEILLENDEPLVLEGKIAALDDNKPLANARRQMFGKNERIKDQNKNMEKTVRELYPYHVFTGWNLTSKGKPVPYNPDTCKEQITSQMEIYTIASIIAHFANPDNFRQLTTQDGEDLGNESLDG